MNRKNLLAPLCISAVGVALIAGSIATAQPPKETKPAAPSATPGAAKPATPAGQPAGQPAMQLPPGWTESDMMACMAAGTPGKQHEHLAKTVGVWEGKTKMWMAPDTEAMASECTATVTKIMDGHYTKVELKGDMPGMGPLDGLGINGFDNVSQKFVGTWIDNHSTGIMTGTGELSADGKTMTWNFTANCPITKKPTTMRQIEKITGDKTMTLEMFATDPKSGKEYKMMVIEYTKKS